MKPDLARDVANVQKLEVVPRILDIVCRATGMGFAAVARVTEDRWMACAVRDDIDFGLQPGGELDVKTTICDEIRQSHELVAIDHVAAEPRFCAHHTPAMYGFQSYISVPLRRPDGSFFGTLCAIDPEPAHVNNVETIGMFTLFADLIGYHLAATDRLTAKDLALLESRQDTGVREDLITILLNELQDPLATIDARVNTLQSITLPPEARDSVESIHGCAMHIAKLMASVAESSRSSLGRHAAGRT